jgi:hypothetical protein
MLLDSESALKEVMKMYDLSKLPEPNIGVKDIDKLMEKVSDNELALSMSVIADLVTLIDIAIKHPKTSPETKTILYNAIIYSVPKILEIKKLAEIH